MEAMEDEEETEVKEAMEVMAREVEVW